MPPPSRLRRPVRVLIADDHRLVAESLMSVLSADERIDVVGTAVTCDEAVELAAELHPDVVLMDLQMPVLGGLEATRRIRDAGLAVQVLLLTTPQGSTDAAEATAAGASAFLPKESGVDELRQVFVEVASLATALGAASAR